MACYDYQRGSCRYGEGCKFSHSGAPGSSPPSGPGGDRYGSGGGGYGGGAAARFQGGGGGGGGGGGPCYQFQRDGNCRYGESCRFTHGAGGAPPPPAGAGGYSDRERPERSYGGYGSSERQEDRYERRYDDRGSDRYGGSYPPAAGAPAEPSYRNEPRREERYDGPSSGGDRYGSSYGGPPAGDRYGGAPPAGDRYGSAPERFGGGGGGYAPRPGGAGPCYSFKESGTCRFGDNCRFTHDGASGGASGPPRGPSAGFWSSGPPRSGGGGGGGPCYQFQRDGTCRYGETCRFTHSAPASGGAGEAAAPGGYASSAERAAPPRPDYDGQPGVPGIGAGEENGDRYERR